MDTGLRGIETPRLILEPTSPAHAQAVFDNFTPEVTRFMFPAAAQAIEETIAFLESAQAANAAGTDLQVAILDRATGEFLGHGGLHHIDTPTPELGIWIKLTAHGHAYGLEAVTALADWAAAHLTIDYLIYPVDRRNAASRRIPERLGGVIAREYTEVNASGNLLELLEYRITPATLTGCHGKNA